MPKVFTSETQKIGQLGEELSSIYLKNLGFKIIERNYYKLIGEIDIIAEKEGMLHFIEVKSVSHETNGNKPIVKPENNFTAQKIAKFKKIMSFYMADKHVSHETKLQIDLLTVYIDTNTKKAQIQPFWNIII